MLPKMSPLNPLYLTKKQTVFQKWPRLWGNLRGLVGRLDSLRLNLIGCGRLRLTAGMRVLKSWTAL